MKLYLSSYLLPNPEKFSEFVGKELNSIKLGIIINSKDDKIPQKKKEKLDALSDYFTNLNMQFDLIDLLDYSNDEELKERFLNYDVIWFVGGNTFSLRSAIKQSNCCLVLKDVLEKGVVYAGDSAGAIVVGPTLKYFDKADSPELVSEIIYEGLNLIDFSILPHWNSEKYNEILQEIELNLYQEGYKTKRLNDNEYLLIENGQIINT